MRRAKKTDRLTLTDQEGTAFHEAGHAAAAVLTGFGVAELVERSGVDQKGCTRVARDEEWPETPELIERGVVFRVAGAVAELAAVSRESATLLDWGNSGIRDNETAEKLFVWAQAHSTVPAEFQQVTYTVYRDKVSRKAMSLLRANWPLVEAIADALLERRSLDQAEVQAI